MFLHLSGKINKYIYLKKILIYLTDLSLSSVNIQGIVSYYSGRGQLLVIMNQLIPTLFADQSA